MANLQLLGVDSLQMLTLSGIETIEGKSAYQYAQDGGYTGTEEEFAAKIAQEIPTKTSQLTNDSGFLTTVDDALSSTSTNPLQNKMVYAALSKKQDTITGAASTVVTSNLSKAKVVVSNANGKIAASSVNSVKLDYLSDVTSSIQAQLDGKAGTDVATSSSNGLMSASDKSKLDGLPSSTVPTLDDDGVLIFN